MTASTTTDQQRSAKSKLRFWLHVIILPLFVAAFFWLAGRLDWIEGWAYFALLFVGYGASTLYVSRGTGFWGPPMRVLAPAEITELVLVRQ